MKLLTHNMLQCELPSATKGYPFIIEAVKITETEADFEPDFIRDLFKKIDWQAFRQGAIALGLDPYPENVPQELLDNEAFLRQLHHGLLEVTLEEGALICPQTGTRFPVSKGNASVFVKNGHSVNGPVC